MKKLCPFFLLCVIANYAAADTWKMRAREHYGTLELDEEGQKTQWKGFSNRFNIWKEKPFEDLYGFAFGSLGGFLSKDDTERLLLVTVGGEWKHFWSSYGFVRSGLYGNRLMGSRADYGASGLLSLGIEFPVGPVGLAFEYAVQGGMFNKYGVWHMTAPAIGVHFYKM